MNIYNAIRGEREAKRKIDREKNKEGKKYQCRASLIRMRNETRTRCLIKKSSIKLHKRNNINKTSSNAK